ncbi:g6994 [Coccomyxa elongata]
MGAGELVFFGASATSDANSGEEQHSGHRSGDAYTVVVQKDDDLEGEGFACPDHEALYDVSMDPEDRTAVFDLAMSQDSDDGGLLDWDALAGKHRYKCCGCDWSCCPCCSCVAPEWWYSYGRRRRSLLQSIACFGTLALIISGGLAVMLWALLSGQRDKHE